MQLTRRHFIGLGFGALTGIAGWMGADALSRGAGGPGLGDLAAVLGEPELWSAKQIGEAWLRANPGEADRAELEGLLSPFPEPLREARSLREPALREWLRDRQREDFAADRIVKLEGWWLSQTEARFCALLSLA